MANIISNNLFMFCDDLCTCYGLGGSACSSSIGLPKVDTPCTTAYNYSSIPNSPELVGDKKDRRKERSGILPRHSSAHIYKNRAQHLVTKPPNHLIWNTNEIKAFFTTITTDLDLPLSFPKLSQEKPDSPNSRWALPVGKPHLHEPAGVFHISSPHLEKGHANVVQHQVIQSPCRQELRKKAVKQRAHRLNSNQGTQRWTGRLNQPATPSEGYKVLYHEDKRNTSIWEQLCLLLKGRIGRKAVLLWQQLSEIMF